MLGLVQADGRSYILIRLEDTGTWRILRPRYTGETIDQILQGEQVVVNVARPKQTARKIPVDGSEINLQNVDFYGIGSVRLIGTQSGAKARHTRRI